MNYFTKKLCYGQFQGSELYHHGILGMHWGQRNGPPYPLDSATSRSVRKGIMQQVSSIKTPENLVDFLDSNIEYEDYKHLKSPAELLTSKRGECHSQAYFTIQQLRKMGKNANGVFFIEYDPLTNQGGQTHSFAYFKDHGTYNWVENAWSTQKGIHSYPSKQLMLDDVKKRHMREQKNKNFTKLAIGAFEPNDHKVGENLQQLVDICLKSN